MSDHSISIAQRYDKLSGQPCCLSCGGAFSMAEIKPGDVCVDLGCGKGHDALRMAVKAGPKGLAYGVDISRGMMDTARTQAERMGVENIRFVEAKLEQIPLNDSMANVVISNCTINHSLRQDLVWKEIFRLLKTGGMFAISDIYSTEIVPDIYRQNPVMVAECWAGSVTKSQYLKNIQDAGFDNVQIVEESAPYDKGLIRVASFTVTGKK